MYKYSKNNLAYKNSEPNDSGTSYKPKSLKQFVTYIFTVE